MKEFLDALHGDFSILITKKDGTFSDQTANYRTRYPREKALEGLKNKRQIAERTDLVIESAFVADEYYTEGNETKTNHYILIGLKEI